MFDVRAESQARAHRQRAARRARTVRRREHVAVRRAHGEPEGVADRVVAEDLVVAHETRQDREPRGVGARPGLGTAVVRRRSGTRRPSPPPIDRAPRSSARDRARRGCRLSRSTMQHVPIAVRRDRPRIAALDPARSASSPVRDRIARRPTRRAGVALVAVVDERDGHQRLAAGDDDVWHAVNGVRIVRISCRAAPVRMEAARLPDVIDEGLTVRVEGRLTDVQVPPVVRRKDWERLRQGAAQRDALRVRRDGRQDTRRQSTDKNCSSTGQNCTPHRGLARAVVMTASRPPQPCNAGAREPRWRGVGGGWTLDFGQTQCPQGPRSG